MSVPKSVPFTEVLLVGVPAKAITKCLCVIHMLVLLHIIGICFINMNHTFVQYKLCPTQEQGKTQVDGDKETVLCRGSWLKHSLP